MLRITGGTVHDPANGIDGVVKDICIADGLIVPRADAARTIDARGMVVFPGGVDVHTHVAGAALNFARGLTPENYRRAVRFIQAPDRRAGLGGITPTTFATGYLYAAMGWTTVNEAAVPILSARHTHEEMHDIPILDKSSLVLIANNEIVLDLLEAGEFERAKDVVAWLVWAAKAYGVKAVNPGGVVAWKSGKNADTLTAPVEGYRTLTPARIISDLAAIIDDLRLPHPLHLHCNNLGIPGNVGTTLETMKLLEGRRAHLAHLQFHAYGGDGWGTLRSEAAPLAEYFNTHTNLTADAGAILFGDAMTVTADGPWEHVLHKLTGRKWGNVDVENETGCGIVPYTYKERSLVNAVQWAVGLELLLLIDDPWRIFLTTDHPNGGSFWRYPELIRLLRDAGYRRECVKRLPPKAQKRIVLADLDREYSLSEIAIITSAGPARALGLSRKGHLGVGADADLALYDEHPAAGPMFASPRYVIKGGEIVVEDGEIRAVPQGREFIARPVFDERIEAYLRPLFEKVYTMSFDNYAVELERLARPDIHACT
ncbi:MAG: formylmethanofuran dehydrogenase subunit A [Candidatus Polarisedimenticolia bacterium]